MTEEELRALSDDEFDELVAAFIERLASEIRRLRAELAAERTAHQELWQMVDRELDRIYCDAKGIERSE